MSAKIGYLSIVKFPLPIVSALPCPSFCRSTRQLSLSDMFARFTHITCCAITNTSGSIMPSPPNEVGRYIRSFAIFSRPTINRSINVLIDFILAGVGEIMHPV